jgi:hypothetical protein
MGFLTKRKDGVTEDEPFQLHKAGACTQFLTEVGVVNPETIYNLCLILKIVLHK